MICLPDRSDRVVDQRTHRSTPLRIPVGEIPHAAPEVGAGKHCVGDHADEHDRRDEGCQAHSRTRRRLGEYGVGRSSSEPSRQRRAMLRSTATAPVIIPA